MAPHPRLNILHGDNGAGKTSVLESMVLLAKGRSFRSGNIAALIGPADASLRVVAKLSQAAGSTTTLGLERSVSAWRARLDGKEVSQFSDLANHLPLVLLEPNSHLLISGPPEGRRRYLDWGVFHVKHPHLKNWRRYSRALKQRNAALRTGDRQLIASLEPQLVQLGNAVDKARRDHVDELAGALEDMLARLSHELGEVTVAYEPGWTGENLEESLAVSIDRDLERGSTQVGPHRGDLVIRMGRQPARERLSRGEQKVAAASLLLAQAGIMAGAGAIPLLLLDDLASEFDRQHMTNVLDECLAMDTQVWVTGTNLETYRQSTSEKAAMFHVKQGEIAIS